jgi:hypothetical protein
VIDPVDMGAALIRATPERIADLYAATEVTPRAPAKVDPFAATGVPTISAMRDLVIDRGQT